MPQFVFDEDRVEVLARRLLVGGDAADELSSVLVRRAREIRTLRQPVLAPGGAPSNDAAVAQALQAANLSLDGFVMGVRSLRSLAEVWREASGQLDTRVADVRAGAITADDLAAGDLLADIRAARPEDVVRISNASVRTFLPDAPAPGEDPELDAALARFDSALLPGLLTGELDTSDLSDQERRDLQLVTDLLGGADTVAFVEERLTFVEVAGEDQPVTVTNDVTFSDADPRFQAAFIRNTLTQRAAATTLAAATFEDVDFDVETINGVGGGEGGDSQESVFGEASFDDGPTVTTEVVDLGGGLERVTVTDTTTGTQFSGVRGQLEDDAYSVSGTVSFPDGTTATVDVFSKGDNLEVTIESDDLQNPNSAVSRDLNRTAPTGFGLIDSLVEIFENFSLFGTNPDPVQPIDLDDNDPFNNDNFKAPNDDTFRDDDNDGFDDGPLTGGNRGDNPSIGDGLE